MYCSAQNFQIVKNFESVDLDSIDTKYHWMQFCGENHMSSASIKTCSNNIKYLFDIYKEFALIDSTSGNCYYMRDSVTLKYIYDLDYTRGVGYVVRSDVYRAMKDVYASYERWLGLLEKEGLESLQHNNIGPLNFTTIEWVKYR